MVDPASRAAPIPAEPMDLGKVVLGLAPPMARYSIRGRDPKAIAIAIGVDRIPDRIGGIANGILCLGPDEWLARLPMGQSLPMGEGMALSVVDVSERSLTIQVEGPLAVEVLSSGCPRNIGEFPVGYGTRTIYEGVEILIIRESAERFAVDVWRSFAPWLWEALTTAARHRSNR